MSLKSLCLSQILKSSLSIDNLSSDLISDLETYKKIEDYSDAHLERLMYLIEHNYMVDFLNITNEKEIKECIVKYVKNGKEDFLHRFNFVDDFTSYELYYLFKYSSKANIDIYKYFNYDFGCEIEYYITNFRRLNMNNKFLEGEQLILSCLLLNQKEKCISIINEYMDTPFLFNYLLNLYDTYCPFF